MVLRRVYRAERERLSGKRESAFMSVYRFTARLPIPVEDERLAPHWREVGAKDNSHDGSCPWYFGFYSVAQVETFTDARLDLFRSLAVKPGPQYVREGETQLIFHETARVDTQPVHDLGGF